MQVRIDVNLLDVGCIHPTLEWTERKQLTDDTTAELTIGCVRQTARPSLHPGLRHRAQLLRDPLSDQQLLAQQVTLQRQAGIVVSEPASLDLFCQTARQPVSNK